MLPEADRIRLRQMADAAAEALGYAMRCTRETLDKNRMLTRAVLHCLLVIGETAAQVTPKAEPVVQRSRGPASSGCETG